MKKKMLFLCFIIGIISDSYGLSKNDINNYFISLQNWPEQYWPEGRSSALIEKGYDRLHYEQVKIWDDDLSTAWVEGNNSDGIGEWVCLKIDFLNGYVFDYEDESLSEKLKIHLKINNGFCKNVTTFFNNNRIKKAKISIFEYPWDAFEDERGTFVFEEPIINSEFEIELNDVSEEQDFEFLIEKKGNFKRGVLGLFLKLTILEVYPGEKYHDTCISEMHATAEVVKEKPADSPIKKRNKNRWRK